MHRRRELPQELSPVKVGIKKYKSFLETHSKCQLLLLLLLSLVNFVSLGEGCEISEFHCDNRKCVSLDKFCNGINDCLDASDEPRGCSPCNRTYYGESGGTYSIAVHRPGARDSQMPYVCQLTFAAGGDKFGDLVQLIFNSVTLGPSPDQDRYNSDKDKPPACREGHVTLNEPDRPATDGHWCGHDWGQAVFFSETSRVTLTLSLLNILSSPGTFAFDFRLSYKFLRKEDAFVRYGPPSNPFYRGQLLSGTFCSLIYNSCDRQRCALQTPNYPGIYPRNVTCYYAIRQLNAPAGHRPVIQLGQGKDHMIFVRNKAVSKKYFNEGKSYEYGGGTGDDSSSGGRGKTGDELTIGDECDGGSDHVTIYDGYTIRDPVLLRFCGGGKFPTIVSSGNELLVEFYSAPTDFLLQRNIHTAIQGFHVDIEIKYLPIGSHTYVENHNCLFTVSSFQQKRGFLTSPQHSLPSGTMCTYLLEGSPGEIVWISLLKFFIGKEYGGRSGDENVYNVAGLTGAASPSGGKGGDSGPSANYMAMMASGQTTSSRMECNNTYLQIWQGAYSEKHNSNATLLAHLCEDTPVKKTCEFMLTSTTSSKPPRACHPDESFISKGPNMSLKLKIETTTVLRPTEFKLYYEFVDTRQDGEPFSHPQLTRRQISQPNLPKMLRSEHSPVSSEFHDANSDEESWGKFDLGSCSRTFKSQDRALQAGSFTSPRNVFYFGRGGVTNLTCVYRFQGGRHERVKIIFNKISLAGGFCKAAIEPYSGRSMCQSYTRNESQSGSGRKQPHPQKEVTEGRVQLWEVPWGGNGSRILKECLCETPTNGGLLSFLSVTGTLDIVLDITNMQPFHDQNHFTFEGRYEFIKHPECSRTQKISGAGGSFTLKQPEKVHCSLFPWEIQPQSQSHHVFLTVPGLTMKKFSSSGQQEFATVCDTRNRILVHSGGFEGHLMQIICPEDTTSGSQPTNTVQIFSEGWTNPELNFPNFLQTPSLTMSTVPSSSQLIVELVSRGPGSNARYDIRYVQITRRDEPLEWAPQSSSSGNLLSGSSIVTTSGGNIVGIDGGHKVITPGDLGGGPGSATSSSSIGMSSSSSDFEEDVCFKFKCPELNACISPTLFCDGVAQCPSGHDEAECEYFPIPKTYLVLAAASLGTFVLLSCCFGCLLCKKRRAEQREKLLMNSRTPTEEMFFSTGGSMGREATIHGRGGGHHREIVC